MRQHIAQYLLLIMSAVLVNNFVLTQFLGICPFLGVSKKIKTAVGMSLAVLFVMSAASAVTWLVSFYFLNPETSVIGVDLTYLRTIAFILVIATFVQLVELAMKDVP